MSDTWEERMAVSAAARRAVREAEAIALDATLPQPTLNYSYVSGCAIVLGGLGVRPED